MEGQVFIPATAQFVQLYAAHEGILVSWLAHSLLSRKTTYVQQNAAPRQIFNCTISADQLGPMGCMAILGSVTSRPRHSIYFIWGAEILITYLLYTCLKS